MNLSKKLKECLNNNWCVFGLFALIATILYVNVINGPFLWDDIALVIENQYTHSFEYISNWFTGENFIEAQDGIYRPISTMAYAAIYQIFELNVSAYHIFLILLHTLNAFLIFVLSQKLKFSKIPSLFIALIFLTHPVQTTSVSYIAGVPDVLNASFVLAGLMLFTNKKTISMIGAAICFILALLSKESGIILLGLAALIATYNWKEYKLPERKLKVTFFITLLILTGIYFWLRIQYLNIDGLALNKSVFEYNDNILIRILTFVSVIWDYAKLTFAPIELSFDRQAVYYKSLPSIRAVFGLIVIIGGLIWSYFSFKKNKKFFLGFLWVFISLGPASGLISNNTTYRENWLYVALIGVGILIATLWEQLKTRKSKTIFVSTFIIILLLFGVKTVYRNFEWANPHAFFENEIKHNPYNPRIYNQYAQLTMKDGDLDKTIELSIKGIEALAPMDPKLTKAQYTLAKLYLLKEDANNAIVHFLMTFETDPNYLKSHEQLAKIFRLGNRPEKAAKFTEFVERIKNGGVVTLDEIKETKQLN
ncbi:MAG: hypothetical protein Q8P68_02575 [Candidatus Peregrinibacteria bacterium]|nr:hypothetical protein [Candidatus Peregrinibacteria bacterium]MDZ4228165.1 hypothetical protein [Candidatus Levybacteria bacterium]